MLWARLISLVTMASILFTLIAAIRGNIWLGRPRYGFIHLPRLGRFTLSTGIFIPRNAVQLLILWTFRRFLHRLFRRHLARCRVLTPSTGIFIPRNGMQILILWTFRRFLHRLFRCDLVRCRVFSLSSGMFIPRNGVQIRFSYNFWARGIF